MRAKYFKYICFVFMLYTTGVYNKKAGNKNKDSDIDFECKKDGYFPDFDDCSKYYLCSAGQVSVHSCGEGLKWDPENQLCSWSDDIECRNGRRPWEKITDLNGVTLFSTRVPKRSKPRKRTTYAPHKPDVETYFQCPWDGEGYYPDPDYCHIYHYCLPGVHTVLECGNGLWFSEVDEGCMWPSEAVCAAAPSTTKTTTTRNTDPNYVEPFITPKTETIYGTIECPNMNSAFYPDPYDCSAYHFCKIDLIYFSQCWNTYLKI